MPLVGALVPGVLSTGVKDPEVPYHGDPFTATHCGVRVSVAPQTNSILGFIRKNGNNIGIIWVAQNTKVSSDDISVSVQDGDWFDVVLAQVGVSPNEGSDLVWLVSGPHTH